MCVTYLSAGVVAEALAPTYPASEHGPNGQNRTLQAPSTMHSQASFFNKLLRVMLSSAKAPKKPTVPKPPSAKKVSCSQPGLICCCLTGAGRSLLVALCAAFSLGKGGLIVACPFSGRSD